MLFENKKRFEKFHDKIIHIVVDKYPTVFTNFRVPTTWDYEISQRNAIAQGLKSCKEQDVIIISDIDEIPDPEKIIKHKDTDGIKVFKQKMYYYFCNCVEKSDNKYWHGSVMGKYKNFIKPQDYRKIAIMCNRSDGKKKLRLKNEINEQLRNPDIVIIENGGWHFSYLGGVEKIVEKIESFAHREYNKNANKNHEKILNIINAGRDLFGRNIRYDYVELDDTFPKYLLQNVNKYSYLIKK